MKNYDFANKLFELRKAQNLSQKELAAELKISNKAISKWENGDAMPSLNVLKQLSQIFNTTIDELIFNNKPNKKQIFKIVITGGPCSGKSTALSWIQNEFTKKGYMVLFVPETATELILGGVTPWTVDTTLNFQTYLLKLQIEKEKIFEEAANHMDNYDKILIVYDRGALDSKAYMTELEFKNCLNKLNTNEITLRDSYDAVFHLVTAANGAEKFYTQENNKARYESAEEAIIKDKATLNAWTGHPRLRVIDNTSNFQEKLRKLIKEISVFLGEPTPLEIERKFLIEYPNIELLEKSQNCKKVEIIQTYLKTENPDEELRIRQRGQNGHYTYTKTIKKNITDVTRIETESRISKDEYLKLLLSADTTKHQIRKDRYCLTYKNQYFEIDIFPFWKDKALLEIELNHENQPITFPKDLKIIKEVTNEPAYKNASIASKINK